MDLTVAHLAFASSFMAFALIHSLTADGRFKERAAGAMGKWAGHYRLAYSVLSVITLLPAMIIYALYSPSSPFLYSLPPILHVPVNLVRLVSALGVWVTLFHMDILGFLGFIPKKMPSKVDTSGLFGHVRHPLYTFLIIFFWARPVMVVMDIMAAILVTAYVVIGARLEEGRLVAEFGDDYLQYKKRVPMFIPRIRGP